MRREIYKRQGEKDTRDRERDIQETGREIYKRQGEIYTRDTERRKRYKKQR